MLNEFGRFPLDFIKRSSRGHDEGLFDGEIVKLKDSGSYLFALILVKIQNLAVRTISLRSKSNFLYLVDSALPNSLVVSSEMLNSGGKALSSLFGGGVMWYSFLRDSIKDKVLISTSPLGRLLMSMCWKVSGNPQSVTVTCALVKVSKTCWKLEGFGAAMMASKSHRTINMFFCSLTRRQFSLVEATKPNLAKILDKVK
ncbi:hypothetical protein WICPIJ_003923 [Wickerhamomyces pijperi]|uniref:Uncharacterized protein n=1 Tax=Wickerhamomyces pijperi TaxID=599730 RepID=A0A9P8Q6K2_WICPI|nr:hypothetical protein WICPIJ_003923 [Wickerhamomyces pijperi]